LRSRIGREGHEWGWAEPGDVAINGQPAKWKKLTPLGQMQNYFWSAYSINYTFNHSEQAGDAVGLEPLLYNSTKLYEPYGNKDVIVPPLWLEKEANERVAQLAADINTYVNESLARFITGDLDLESDWDKYVKKLENMGLAEYLEIYQKAYDAKYKK